MLNDTILPSTKFYFRREVSASENEFPGRKRKHQDAGRPARKDVKQSQKYFSPSSELLAAKLDFPCH
jgi:hypothetical protein